MRQRHAEPCIPDVVHEPQRRPGEESIGTVILDDHCLTSDSTRIGEQYFRVRGVVQDVSEKDYVERAVRNRKPSPVEHRNGDPRIRAGHDVESVHADVWPLSKHGFGEQSIPASDIQHRCVLGKEWSDRRRQGRHAARLHILLVESFDEAHRRFIPRMLMKKLDNTV